MAWLGKNLILKMDGITRAYDVDFPDWDNLFLLEDGSGTQPDGFSIARNLHGM